MSYGIYDKKTHLILERNLAQDTTFAMIDKLIADYPEDRGRFIIVKEVEQGWVCTMTMQLVPVYNLGLPCAITRKKVYNERVIGRPAFWELTTYNQAGERLLKAQYTVDFKEGYLAGLVEDYFGFPLEAAEEIE